MLPMAGEGDGGVVGELSSQRRPRSCICSPSDAARTVARRTGDPTLDSLGARRYRRREASPCHLAGSEEGPYVTEQDDSSKLPWRERRDIAVQAGLQLLPGVGSSLAQLWSGYSTAKRLQRIERFFEELARNMEAFAATVKLNAKQKAELPTLIQEVLDRVEREIRETKVAWLQAFLGGAIVGAEAWDLPKRQAFLQTLDSLTTAHLGLLCLLREHEILGLFRDSPTEFVWLGFEQREHKDLCCKDLDETWTVPFSKARIKAPIDRGVVTLLLAQLVGMGLVELQEAYHRSSYLKDGGPAYSLTSVGREFLEAFDFPDGEPVFEEPWRSVQKTENGEAEE